MYLDMNYDGPLKNAVKSFHGLFIIIIIIIINSVTVVRKLTIPTERPPLVGEVSANLCG
jgi:hypothetical protein